jgi:hypothetical protein
VAWRASTGRRSKRRPQSPRIIGVVLQCFKESGRALGRKAESPQSGVDAAAAVPIKVAMSNATESQVGEP